MTSVLILYKLAHHWKKMGQFDSVHESSSWTKKYPHWDSYAESQL